MIEDCGDLSIDSFDDANVPVDIWLTELTSEEFDDEVNFMSEVFVFSSKPLIICPAKIE